MLALMLTIALIFGFAAPGALSYNVEDTPPFPDEESVPGRQYVTRDNAPVVEVDKYLKIYEDGTNKVFSEGKFGEISENAIPISPLCPFGYLERLDT
jgi:hypothetical protein